LLPVRKRHPPAASPQDLPDFKGKAASTGSVRSLRLPEVIPLLLPAAMHRDVAAAAVQAVEASGSQPPWMTVTNISGAWGWRRPQQPQLPQWLPDVRQWQRHSRTETAIMAAVPGGSRSSTRSSTAGSSTRSSSTVSPGASGDAALKLQEVHKALVAAARDPLEGPKDAMAWAARAAQHSRATPLRHWLCDSGPCRSH